MTKGGRDRPRDHARTLREHDGKLRVTTTTTSMARTATSKATTTNMPLVLMVWASPLMRATTSTAPA